jgi:hypothetical protein
MYACFQHGIDHMRNAGRNKSVPYGMGVPSKDTFGSLEQKVGAGFIPDRACKQAMYSCFPHGMERICNAGRYKTGLHHRNA